MQVICPSCHTTNRIPYERISDGPKCGQCKKPVIQTKPIDLDSSSFLKHINNSDLPVIVDFWADWCGPCKMMAPIYEKTTGEMNTKFQFTKLDTQKHQQLAARYKIQSIPTLAVFRRGKEIARQSGALPAQQFKQWLDNLKI